MTNAAPDDPRIEQTIGLFATIYLGGLPSVITNDSAFLSFICVLTATEALAGFRYALTLDERGKPLRAGPRFRQFIEHYYPAEYKPLAARLWTFRCRMLHAFSTAGFALTHHHSENHLRRAKYDEGCVLNAEDFYAAMLFAAQKYFAEVRADSALKQALLARIDDRKEGGAIGVGPIALA